MAVPASRPPSLRELMFDAANVCTILAILFDMFALAVTLRDKNFHLAIALGQISAMYARVHELQHSQPHALACPPSRNPHQLRLV